ncbi:Na(+)/H(+) exchange regulatory cofactor NHE-RF3 [Rana temporaria]|uniref:Na(+)/H(+) exchange regulatory cofactor NHE-RF3 n=1 Tax=Rana temporaria TaxID=8407 RepID=UPI001AADA5D2|nr:Na(+)/H(+) exchange regulatory cofactor NHE-RF3 [Rana temporaria]XP_040194995.1 Na(+)/H(+) exchange regulatory cofactor NHE-RF3 [Rana temporaria]
MASTVQPRECTVNKAEGKGYGFFLRVEQDDQGHLVRSIEKGSAADKAGLKDGDRVMKVNGVFVDDKDHPEVVELIKASGNSVSLSVLDKASYKKSKENTVDPFDGKPPSYESVSSKPSESSTPKPSESSTPKPSESSTLKPRLCYLVKDKGSFGFSLKCIKGTTGVFLDNLAPSGPAVKAGVQTGDRIIEVNGKNVISDTYDQVVKLVKESGDSVMYLVVDEATYNHFQQNKNRVTADQATTSLLPHLPRIVELTKATDGYGFYLRQEKHRKGHYIVEIDPQGPADKAKLKEFDRVVAVNGQSVEQMQHEQVVETIRKGGDKTTLLISDKTVDDLYAKAGLSPFVYLKEIKTPSPAKTETSKPVEKPKPVETPLTKPAPAPQPAASTPTPDPKQKPRLCSVQKGDKGFGFNLNAIKDVPGQYIKQVLPGGPGDKAGIKEDDVLVEVNGVNVEKESYDDVIMRIKNAGRSVTLLVVSKEGSEYYKSQKIQITASLADPLPENKNTPDDKKKPTPDNNTKPTPDNNTKPTPDDKTKPTPDDKTKPTPDDKTKPTPDDKTKPTPDDKTKPTPEDKTKPTPDDKTKNTPDDEKKPTPDDKTKNTPDDEKKPTPDDKTKNTPDEGQKTPPSKARSAPEPIELDNQTKEEVKEQPKDDDDTAL